MVNMTGKYSNSDLTLEVRPEDYPITKPTVISYADARVVELEYLERFVSNGLAEQRKTASQDLVDAILLNAPLSENINDRFLNFCRPFMPNHSTENTSQTQTNDA